MVLPANHFRVPVQSVVAAIPFNGFVQPVTGDSGTAAATTVVSDMTEASLQAAIDTGGKIFVLGTGPFAVATGFTFPDKDVTIEVDPRITFTLGLNAIALFTVPAATLTARRFYNITNLKVTGGNVANQYIWTTLDATGLSTTHIRNYYFTGMKAVPNFAAGDATNYLQTVELTFEDGYNIPPSAGTDPGFVCYSTADNYAIPAVCRLIRSNWTDESNPTRGYVFDVDLDIILTYSKLAICDGTSECDGFSVINSSVQGETDDGVCVLQGNSPSTATQFSTFSVVLGLTLDKCQVHFMRNTYHLDGISLDNLASISLRANGLCCRNLVNADETHSLASRFVEITADDCSLIDCRFRMSASLIVAAVRNYGLRTRGIGLSFSTSGGTPKTWDDVTPGTADYTVLDGCTGLNDGAGPVLAANAVVEGALLASATAVATTDAYVTVFTHTNPRGLLGIGTIKNTDGVDSMTVRETVIDAFGVTDATTETPVAAGNDYPLDPQTNFGSARPPYFSYKVEVKATVPGSQAAYTLRHVSQGAEV